ncbi:hypothetical protein H5410_007842 [Solanum commersonii]|uniref:Uncharacterized protein n=1 Tax=Solanum commersonii TaxID=4109 RepID=A0A9J6ADK2_SOLCO|nr:hypothetical protein H5410_007842 [Solanum commersonii]
MSTLNHILLELVKRYLSFACRRTLKNNLKGSVHIATTSKFFLLRRSLLVGAVHPQGFVVVVVVDLVVRTEVGLHGGGDGDGRRQRGEQTKALAMPLMEVN